MSLPAAFPIAIKGVTTGWSIPDILDFAAGFSLNRNYDLTAFARSVDAFSIQGIFIDNSNNPLSVVTITIGGTNQKFIIPAGAQGTARVFNAPGSTLNLNAVSSANGKTVIDLLNFPVDNFIWQNTSSGIPVVISGTVNVRPVSVTSQDLTGFIVVGGLGQELTPALVTRVSMLIENPATAGGQGIAAAESLFVRIGNDPAGVNDGTSYEVTPGGYWPTGAMQNISFTDRVTVNAATINHRFIATQFHI